METAKRDEWGIIERLLPPGWREAARDEGAFRRVRYTESPSALLRLLLYHAVSDGGLRTTVAQARAAGIGRMSAVALFKRLRTSASWLAWVSAELCRPLREQPRLPKGMRPRAIDSTTIQGPKSLSTEWRLHYTLDLVTLACDWHELTDATGAEAIERTPIRQGDVILGDRNFSRAEGIRHTVRQGGHVLVRLRWRHCPMVDQENRRFEALSAARRLRVGEVGDWPVRLQAEKDNVSVEGRVVVIKLPAPLARKAERRVSRIASKKGRKLDPRSAEAAHFVMLFTTVPHTLLRGAGVLGLYRFRWQVELAFKRLKQLLRLGRLPHADPRAAQSWILAKLVVALLLETLYRKASAFSPWGYPVEDPEPATD